MAGLNPMDRDNLGHAGVEADQGFALDKTTEPLEQQVGADDDLQRGLERVAALEAWLSAGREQGNGLNALGDSRPGRIPDHQGINQGIGLHQSQDRTLVVVDSRLSNWEEVAAGLPADADLLLLDQRRSGLQQVEEAAQNAQREGTNYRAVALLGSEAEGGIVQFGQDDLGVKETPDINNHLTSLKKGVLGNADVRLFSHAAIDDSNSGTGHSANLKPVQTKLGTDATNALEAARTVLRGARSEEKLRRSEALMLKISQRSRKIK